MWRKGLEILHRNWALINIGWNKNKWNKMEIKDIKWNIWISKATNKWKLLKIWKNSGKNETGSRRRKKVSVKPLLWKPKTL